MRRLDDHWQGESGDVTTGDDDLAAHAGALPTGTKVTFAADGTGAAGADVGVVVVGETPYAEVRGDAADLALPSEDLAAIANVEEGGRAGGRRARLGPAADPRRGCEQADAIVAAWLPGTEGEGVADVLFGDYKPTGKLSFTWPRSMSQIPINVGDAELRPAVPFGFGLSY